MTPTAAPTALFRAIAHARAASGGEGLLEIHHRACPGERGCTCTPCRLWLSDPRPTAELARVVERHHQDH